jgi:hypothetical protein
LTGEVYYALLIRELSFNKPRSQPAGNSREAWEMAKQAVVPQPTDTLEAFWAESWCRITQLGLDPDTLKLLDEFSRREDIDVLPHRVVCDAVKAFLLLAMGYGVEPAIWPSAARDLAHDAPSKP